VTALGEEGKHRTGNCVAALISQLYRFARSELERDVQNPAADMRPFDENPRERVLSEDEIRAFWTGLEDPSLPPGPSVTVALKLALFTCQRRGEIAGMRDEELDFDNRIWRVPGDRTKSGRPNVVPLTQTMVDLIVDARSLRGKKAGSAVFPSFVREGQSIHPHAISKGMARLMAKLKFEATPHHLRRTGRTLLSLERLGVSHDDAERLMSHAVGSAVSRVCVINQFVPEQRRALEQLDVELKRILSNAGRH
jgi:integrase